MMSLIGFNICALFILILIAGLHIIKERSTFNPNIILTGIIICNIAAALSDSMHYIIREEGGSGITLHHCSYIFIGSIIVAIYFIFLYILSMSGLLFLKILKSQLLLTAVPAIISLIMLFANSFTGILFTFSEEGTVIFHPLMAVPFIIAFIYLAASFASVFLFGNTLKNTMLYSLCFLVFISAAGGAVQLLDQQRPVFCIASALGLLCAYLCNHNQERISHPTIGTYNRYAYIHVASLCEKLRHPITVLMLHVEGVSILNRQFGEERVNKVILREIGRFLNSLSKDRVYYINDCTFAILMVESSRVHKFDLAESIIQRFQKKWFCDGSELSLTAMLGFVNFPEDSTSVSFTFDFSYYLKNLSSGDYSTPMINANTMEVKNRERSASIEKALNDALINREHFEVEYQPVYSVIDRAFRSAEALIRINDPVLGYIHAEEFIPIAEANGTILTLGAIILDEVCSFYTSRHLDLFGIDFIGINLSFIECMSENLLELYSEIILKYNMSPNRICLDLTENAIENTPQMMQVNVNALHDMGMRFSLDDYGTGYSSVSRLTMLPFELVKLDQSLVMSACADSPKAKIALRSSILMLQRMNLSVLAEGIETEEQYRYLSELGCDYIQGFYFAKPMDKRAFIRFLNEQT